MLRTVVAAIALSSSLCAQAAPPPNPEPLDHLITRGCGFGNFAFVARVSRLQTEPPVRDETYPNDPPRQKQVAEVTIVELIKGDANAVPRTLSGYKRVPLMTDQLGVDLEDNKVYLVLMDWNGAPGRELVRFPELNYDMRLNKYTDNEFKELLQVARKACRP